MARDTTFDHLKGMNAGVAIIAVVAVIGGAILFFPNLIGGLNFGGGASPIGVGPGNAGVVITSFVGTPPIGDSGEEFNFLLTAENRGGVEAKSIKYEIFGLKDSNSWSGSSVVSSGETELSGVDVSRQNPGEKTQHEWSSTSKEKNVDITYPVTGRVDYQYFTEAHLLLTLYGRDNENVKNLGVTQSQMSVVSNTAGPITVTPKGTIPLVGKNTDDFRITFDISNTGGGRPYSGSKGTGIDKMKITATGCTLTQTGDIKLISGIKTVSCKVKPIIDSLGGKETQEVVIKLDYNYVVESTANVKVIKKPE